MVNPFHGRGLTGIGVITCNRPSLFNVCIQSIPDVDVLVVVNDGDPYPTQVYPSRMARLVQHDRRLGVAFAKNDALRALVSAGCRHIFLCEDDIRILNPQLCREYIQASDRTGIGHFNFGYHGPRNKSESGVPSPRTRIDYGDGVSIALNRHLVGAFSYYRSDVLESVGLLDTRFRNMLDHVEHTYRIIERGFHPPFWWFADLADSPRFIEDLDPDLRLSTMRYGTIKNAISFRLSDRRFRRLHGMPTRSIPDVEEAMVRRLLAEMCPVSTSVPPA